MLTNINDKVKMNQCSNELQEIACKCQDLSKSFNDDNNDNDNDNKTCNS